MWAGDSFGLPFKFSHLQPKESPMNDITAQWLIPITTNLIAAMMIWFGGKTFARARESIIKVKGVAIMATKRIFPAVFNALVYIGALYFSISRLVFLVTFDAPVQRIDVLMISVFTAFFTVTVVAIVLGVEIWPSAQRKEAAST